MDALFTTAFLVAVLRSTAPLLLATMGSVVTERAGISNIGVEGMMLAGAFTGVVVTIESGQVWLGTVAAVAAGVLLGLVLAAASVGLGADAIVAGFAINVLAAGVTVLLMSSWYGSKGSVSEIGMPTLPTWRLPVEDVPVLGAVASQNIAVWWSFAAVAATWVLVFRTRFGLRVTAVGDNSEAARAAGVPVARTRTAALAFGGLTAGLAGAGLSLGYLSSFTRDMTAGRGFIALAAAIFGRRNPLGAAAAALLFGATAAAGDRLQNEGYPSQLVKMLPYVATVVALSVIALRGVRRRRRADTNWAPA